MTSHHARPSSRWGRRQVLGAAGLGAVGVTGVTAATLRPALADAPRLHGTLDPSSASSAPLAPVRTDPPPADPDVVALERKHGVRLGLYAENLRSGKRIGNRSADRFALCSTGKVLVVGDLLFRGVGLDRRVRIREQDLVDYSPITGLRDAMTVAELCDATLRYSDNTAVNLLLPMVGGPKGVTRDVRRTGDTVTRLDRDEPSLNSAVPGDPRDTTSPLAIATTYRTLLLGEVLPTIERQLLRAWMTGNTTSVGKFRRGLPEGWWFADKTGSGKYGSSNDVGLVTSPDGTELMVSVMARDAQDREDAATDPQLFVDAARLIVDKLV